MAGKGRKKKLLTSQKLSFLSIFLRFCPSFSNFAHNMTTEKPSRMKTYKRFLMLFAICILAATSFSSCEWDASEEPEHPLYVSYSISASEASFVGPDQLLVDILTWIKENQKVYDVKANYSTGHASEFAKTDADAIKYYDEFASKFKAYLEQEVTTKLNKGYYKSNNSKETTVTVNASFHVYAQRIQGEDGNLKYEDVKFSYP